ncbi:hypothetical protein ACP70R_027025 [Stipagrostis hirtigluma subsp. patula]
MAAVRSVWADSFAAESAVLCDVATRATHVAFNVQYPGCIVPGFGGGQKHYTALDADERYAHVQANVNPLQPLQVGLAVRTDDGRLLAWEFNLSNFDIATDGVYRCAPDSVAYLANRGVDFWRLKYDGVPGYRLRWLLRDSGLIRARPRWATFAGAFHVAYLLKIMVGEYLPAGLDGFMGLVRDKIGANVYDVKLMAREHDQGCRGPLKLIAKQLGVAPTEGEVKGLAGAAAVLALQSFEVLKAKLGNKADEYCNKLCGLQTF